MLILVLVMLNNYTLGMHGNLPTPDFFNFSTVLIHQASHSHANGCIVAAAEALHHPASSPAYLPWYWPKHILHSV